MFHFAIFGMSEVWPVLIIVILLFGARKLPDLARSLGGSINEFKKGMADGVKDENKSTPDTRSSTQTHNGKDH